MAGYVLSTEADILRLEPDSEGDTVDGRSGDDLITAAGSADILYGNLGNDTLLGGDGADSVYGYYDNVTQDGNDVLYGGNGRDYVGGGGGQDSIYGGNGVADALDAEDTLFGDDGDDIIYGNGSIDVIYGGAGKDTIWGGFGNDSLIGGSTIADSPDDADLFTAGPGADTIYATGGNDTIYGGSGFADTLDTSDMIYAGSGDDYIFGNGGNDSIVSGPGHDVLIGGFGNNSLVGGEGTDRFIITSDEGASNRTVIEDFSSTDVIQIREGASALADLDVFQSGDDVNILFNNGYSIILTGQSVLDVQAAQFTFSSSIPPTPPLPPDTPPGGNDPMPPPLSFTLTSNTDIFVGNRNRDSFYATEATLQPTDSLSGRDGTDTLFLTGGGKFNLAHLARFTGIERIIADNSSKEMTIPGGIVNVALGAGDDTLTASLSGLTSRDIVRFAGGNDLLILTGGGAINLAERPSVTGYEFVKIGDISTSVILAAPTRGATGGNGNDIIDGSLGNAVIQGMGGADSLTGGIGASDIVSYAASSLGVEIHLNISDHSIYNAYNNGTDAQDDTLSGFEGVEGGGGNDKLWGHNGNSLVFGNGGNDYLSGQLGFDTVHGGSGNDTVLGGEDADELAGDDGFDIVSYLQDTQGIEIHLDILDQGVFPFNYGSHAQDDTISGFEAVIGGSGSDRLFGSNNADSLTGYHGNDYLSGLQGRDTLNGGSGNDTLFGGEGSDSLAGDDGFDLLSYLQDTRGVEIHLGVENHSIYGFNNGSHAQGDTLTGFEGVEGGSGADILWASASSGLLVGHAGNDRLNGQGGSDSLIGGDGSDILRGGNNNDLLTGGVGVDDLQGDAGIDIFIFQSITDSGVGAGRRDIVRGFTPGSDKLDFDAIVSSVTVIGTSAFTGTGGAELRQYREGGFTIAALDANGDAITDTEFLFSGTINLLQGDL